MSIPGGSPSMSSMAATPSISGKLLPMLTKLRHAFEGVNVDQSLLDLPRLVVVGSQSSGKSSVLEHIVGKDFLPRGTGIVTRCPLVLHLRNTVTSPPDAGSAVSKYTSSGTDMCATFHHKPESVFTDFTLVCKEITEQTDRLVGKQGACIADMPIELTIYGRDVLNLSLVDLPGITKVPVGNQPSDIEKIVRTMILRFISNTNTIIIGVTSANQDLANSDALQLAKSVDPAGDRTISVLTKVDLMDEGTSCANVLAGCLLPLKLGHFAVVNRSQRDIERGKSIKEAIESERKFFTTHVDYRTVRNQCSVTALTQALSHVLLQHVSHCLPRIQERIHELRLSVDREYAELGANSEGGDNNSSRLLHILGGFSEDYTRYIDGSIRIDHFQNELSGGARIAYLMHEHFRSCIQRMEPLKGVSTADIRTVLYNSSGATPSLFINSLAFEQIVQRQILRLHRPVQECVQQTHDELVRIVTHIFEARIGKQVEHLPNLKVAIRDQARGMLRDRLTFTEKMVREFIDSEAGYINTTHPDFPSGEKAMHVVRERLRVQREKRDASVEGKVEKKLEKQKEETSSFFGSLTGKQTKSQDDALQKLPTKISLTEQTVFGEREQTEIETVVLLIKCYYNIVKRTVFDVVPKLIFFYLINYTKKNLHSTLVGKMYANPEKMEELMSESASAAQRRRECMELRQALDVAEQAIAEVRSG